MTKKQQPTPQQRAFIDAVMDPTAGHLCLRARAGTGKSTTIVLGVEQYAAANPDHEVVICAYNKAITNEMAEKIRVVGLGEWRVNPATGRKVPPRVQVSTAHSLGLSAIKWLFKPEIDDKKVRKLVEARAESANSDEQRHLFTQYGRQVEQLVRMAKQAGFGFFSDLAIHDNAAWHRLADHFDINGLDDTSEADAVVEAAQRVYRDSLDQTGVIDFDDMILFPLVKNVRVKFTKDLVVVDEAQDLSRARQALLRKFLNPGGRMIIVGDDRQAIYGFSGADAAALENLVAQLGATVLPLSVTWRCPKKVVELARTIVPDIEAAPSAPEGEVLHIQQMRPSSTCPTCASEGFKISVLGSDRCEFCDGTEGSHAPTTQERADWLAAPGHKIRDLLPWFDDPNGHIGKLLPTDAVLCRNTAPLVSLAYKLIRAGVPCKVEGRAIGEGLKALASRWKVKTVDALRKRLETYKERERQKALAKGNESKAAEVEDRVATLTEICAACAESGKHQLSDVLDFIDGLFADGAENVTVLATYHRSKGREWDRVFLLEHAQRCPAKAARQPWQIAQESNLAYVAYTRAKQTLVFVD